MYKKDGHIHTPFCPHGTKDSLNAYVERAISQGFNEITFAEHAPLPRHFVDTTPQQDSAMAFDELENYLSAVEKVKEEYRAFVKINTGLEVDYIEGFEKEIKHFLDEFGPRLDDAVLSVHFLKNSNQYDCLDYSPDFFQEMIEKYGTVEKIYKKYFETLHLSILSDLGKWKPKRIGHITLVHKFQKKFPSQYDSKVELIRILTSIKEKGYELDYNGAGTIKPLCLEPYPPEWVAKKAIQMGIPLIYGSDAHQVKELSQGLDCLIKIK